MKKILIIILFSFISISLNAQINCEAFKYYGDTLKYRACKKYEEAEKHYQFSREFQQIMDEAITIDPTFDYAYREKSVAYLKSGDFISWKVLIDKAVELNPKMHLSYRAACRYHTFRDYIGTIRDIEILDSIVPNSIGYSAGGEYHLNTVKAICYKALGQQEKAISILENQLKDKDKYAGIYAYMHLGVLYLESGKLNDALIAFDEQSIQNEVADNQYYKALVYKYLGDKKNSRICLEKAKNLYQNRYKVFDPYNHPFDKVYFVQIENELNEANKE